MPLENFGGTDFGPITVTDALTNSVNTVFAQIGEQVGRSTLVEYMKRYGFYEDPKLDFPDDEMIASGIREADGDLVEDVIADRLQRVRGVSQVDYAGGSARELQVIIEPGVLAGYGLTVPRVLQALREANVTLTAGAVDEGKRRYVVRAEGEFETVLGTVSFDDNADVFLPAAAPASTPAAPATSPLRSAIWWPA